MRSHSEIRALTGLRGAAASWVALHHICREPGFEAPILQGVLLRGYLAVDLFFVLSGFVLSLAYAEWFLKRVTPWSICVFMVRRLARVWPLHAAVLLLLLGAYYAVGGEPLAAAPVLANIALVQAWGFSASLNPSSWSLSTECAAYLLFPLLAPFVLHGRRSLWVAALGSGTLLLLAVVFMAPSTAKRYGALDIPDDWSLVPLLRCLGGFIIGMVTYGLSRRSAAGALLSRHGVGGGAAVGLPVAVAVGVPDLLLYPLLPLLVASLAMSSGWITRLLSSPPLHWLGVVSYALYLVHVPIFRIAFGSLHPSFMTSAAFFGWMLSVAWLAHVSVERPGRRLGLLLARQVGLEANAAAGKRASPVS